MWKTSIQKTAAYLMIASLALMLAACEKLPTAADAQLMPSIPAELGDLKGVTTEQDQPYQSVLWFEQADKTIVAVRVNFARGTILANTVKIPRK